MATPWMPLYVADYLADTQHLSTEEHGAYLLLLLHHWRQGQLPTDDERLARIAKLSVKDWLRIRPTIAEFFDSEWRQKRAEFEREKAEQKVAARKAAGAAGARKRHQQINGKGIANATAKA